MSTVIPVQEPIFAYTSAGTFDEYCQTQPTEYRDLLRRIYAGARIDAATQLYLATYPVWLTAVLILEEQTPDTAMIAPIVQRFAECCPRLEVRYCSADGDLSALNELADDDLDLEEELEDMDLPLLIFFDDEWNQAGRWGPRPAAAEDRLDAWLNSHPRYDELLDSDEEEDSPELEVLIDELIHQMRVWYNDDLTAACVQEIRELLEGLEPEE